MMNLAENFPKDITERRLKTVFSHYQYHPLPDKKGIKAAVLCPLFIDDQQVHLLFIKRSQTVKKHKGEISFPGGVYEKSDVSLLSTCLRETKEEVGIRHADVTIIGRLDEVYTTTGYMVSPFVGIIPYPYTFNICKKEVESLLPVNATSLENSKINGRKSGGLAAYRVQGEIIWGATAKIADNLLGLLKSCKLIIPE